MTEIETTNEYQGETALLVLTLIVCCPLGFFLMWSESETMWVCPECKETVEVGAKTCAHCKADLTEYSVEDA